ncbi:hypothetical protein HK104_002708, partial [Borealophlyctis nickersoniae]
MATSEKPATTTTTTTQELSLQAQSIVTTAAHSKKVSDETLHTLETTVTDLEKTSAQIQSLLDMTKQTLAGCVVRVAGAKKSTETYLTGVRTAAESIAEVAVREAKMVQSAKEEYEERKREVEDEFKVMALEHQEAMNVFLAKNKVQENVASVQKKKVKLDIGGAIFSISLDTLLSQKETFFSSLFREEWQVKPGDDGTIFIDRDPTPYRFIFNWMRDGAQAVMPDDKVTLNAIVKEASFLCLEGLKTTASSRVAAVTAEEAKKATQ